MTCEQLEPYLLEADGEEGGKIQLRQLKLVDKGITHALGSTLLIETKGISQRLCTESAQATNTNECNLTYCLHEVCLTQINTILTV